MVSAKYWDGEAPCRQAVSTILLKRMDFHINRKLRGVRLKDISLDNDRFWQDLSEDLMLEIEAFLYGQDVGEEIVKYPADWKEAFKERWFTARMKRLWPVKYITKEITVKALFPDLQNPLDGEATMVIRRMVHTR